MTTRSDGIVPGTVAYGDREQLAGALDSAGQEASAPPAATSGSAGVGGPLDPLQAMLTGGVPPSDDPITSGLSKGPGLTPAPQVSPKMTPLEERLLYVAQHAKSPSLRGQARMALRGLAKRRG